MKILLIDIETVPHLGWFWSLRDEYISPNQLVEATEMLCFGAKWLGEKKTRWFGDNGTRAEMVKAAHELLDQADVAMHWNGKRFDVPHLNREFHEQGLTPPSPYRQLDLMNAVKKVFRLPSYKLDYVSKWMGVGEKIKHSGFDLWVRCMAGEPAAWRQMETYNRQDVDLLEDIYNEIQPWIPQHPSYGSLLGKDVCPNCGSDDLERRGYAYTDVSAFQQYRCRNCGKWVRSTKRSSATTIREVYAA